MKQHFFGRRLLWLALQLAGWMLLVLTLSRLLAVQAEEITIVDGVEKRVLYTQPIAPQIAVAVAMTAILANCIVWWIFPRWFDRKKIRMGIGITCLLAAGLLLLEYLVFRMINMSDMSETLHSVYENGILIKEEKAGDVSLQETIWSFWNLALFLLGGAAAFAWSFAGAWQRQLLDWQGGIGQPPAVSPGTLVSLKSGAEIHQVALDEILFLKKEGNYFEVFTQKKKIVIRQNMETALQWLPAQQFCRVHRSYIVALRHVALFKNNMLMVGEYEVPVGAGYKAAIGSVLLSKAN